MTGKKKKQFIWKKYRNLIQLFKNMKRHAVNLLNNYLFREADGAVEPDEPNRIIWHLKQVKL